jgi:hypothetical protein
MTTTTTELRPRRSRRASLKWIAPAVLAGLVLVLIVNLASSLPGRASITVENRTGAAVTVDANDARRSGWVGIGTIDPESKETVAAVPDLGRVWRFRLTVGPDRIGEITRTADELRAAGWQIVIPAEAADFLPPSRRG